MLSCALQAGAKEIAKPIAGKIFSGLKAKNAFRATSIGGEIFRIRQVENWWGIVGKPIEGVISLGSQKIGEKNIIRNSKDKIIDNNKKAK